MLVFKKKIKKLIDLDIEPLKNWHTMIFIARCYERTRDQGTLGSIATQL
jgi:hypothetical protein